MKRNLTDQPENIMVEMAIDNLVWDSQCHISHPEQGGLLGKSIQWIRDIPWYASFNYNEIQVYCEKKIAEHEQTIRKLVLIQDSITDIDQKASLRPLINHYKWLSEAYNDVSLANSIDMHTRATNSRRLP